MEDIAHDVLLKMLDFENKKGVIANKDSFFFISYRNAYYNQATVAARMCPLAEALDKTEQEVQNVYPQIYRYVQKKYTEMETAVFEIYFSPHSDLSQTDVSKLTGLSRRQIRYIINKIVKDLKND
jgi:DNA-directed RNA polymerase specialized sigma subunit